MAHVEQLRLNTPLFCVSKKGWTPQSICIATKRNMKFKENERNKIMNNNPKNIRKSTPKKSSLDIQSFFLLISFEYKICPRSFVRNENEWNNVICWLLLFIACVLNSKKSPIRSEVLAVAPHFFSFVFFSFLHFICCITLN